MYRYLSEYTVQMYILFYVHTLGWSILCRQLQISVFSIFARKHFLNACIFSLHIYLLIHTYQHTYETCFLYTSMHLHIYTVYCMHVHEYVLSMNRWNVYSRYSIKYDCFSCDKIDAKSPPNLFSSLNCRKFWADDKHKLCQDRCTVYPSALLQLVHLRHLWWSTPTSWWRCAGM